MISMRLATIIPLVTILIGCGKAEKQTPIQQAESSRDEAAKAISTAETALHRIDDSLNDARDELALVRKEKSGLVQRIAELEKKNQELHAQLDQEQKARRDAEAALAAIKEPSSAGGTGTAGTAEPTPAEKDPEEKKNPDPEK